MTYGNAEIGSATFKIAYDGSELEEGLKIADSQMRSFGRTVGAFGAGILGAAGLAVKFAVDQETAMVEVQKTVEGTAEQYKQLEKDIVSLTKKFGISFQEAARFASIAGQLGVEVEKIFSVTDTALTMQIAIPEGDPVTMFRQLARFTQLMDGSIDNLDEYNNQLIGLGNNFNTTEAEIINLAVRMAPSARAMGLSAEQTLAWATTMKVAGLNSEMARTAFVRMRQFFLKVATDTPKFIKDITDALKITEEELPSLFTNIDDEGIKKLAAQLNMSVEDVQANIESFGGSGSRFEDAFGLGSELEVAFQAIISGDQEAMNALVELLGKDEHTIRAAIINDYDAFLLDFFDALSTKTKEEGDVYIQNILDVLGFKGTRLQELITAMATNFTAAVEAHEFTEDTKNQWDAWEVLIANKLNLTVDEVKAIRELFAAEVDGMGEDADEKKHGIPDALDDTSVLIMEEKPSMQFAIQSLKKLSADELILLVAEFEQMKIDIPHSIKELVEKLNTTEVDLNQLIQTFKQVAVSLGQALVPTLDTFLDEDGWVMKGLSGLTTWMSENPGVTSFIANIALAFGALFLATGVLAIAAPGLIVFKTALNILRLALMTSLVAFGGWGTGMGAVVTGSIIAMYLFRDEIWSFYLWVDELLGNFFTEDVPNFVESGLKNMREAISAGVNLSSDAGKKLMAVLSDPVGYTQNIMQNPPDDTDLISASQRRREALSQKRREAATGPLNQGVNAFRLDPELYDPLDVGNIYKSITGQTITSGEGGSDFTSPGLPSHLYSEDPNLSQQSENDILQDDFITNTLPLIQSLTGEVERLSDKSQGIVNNNTDVTVNIEGSLLAEQDLEAAIELAIESSRQAGYDDEPVSSEGTRLGTPPPAPSDFTEID